jgi:phosphatidylinositol 4-kinase
MSICKDIFEVEKSWLYLRVYNTFSNALDQDNLGGLIEVMLGTKSISEMINENEMNLTQCMLDLFDEQNPQFLKSVRENFIHSTAAYSLLTYVLQIKDR